MTGLNDFKQKGSQFVSTYGYVLGCKKTGHKAYWWDFDVWKKEQEMYDMYPEMPVNKTHKMALAKWERMALNVPTQLSGAVILKRACTLLFNYIVDNNYFNKILFVNFTHDEINSEFPENLKDIWPKVVQDTMSEAAKEFYTELPFPAEASVGKYWIH